MAWTAVTHATSYGVYQSHDGHREYTLADDGHGCLTWTSAALATGNYWYEVAVKIGTNWAGANSTATAKRTISSTTAAADRSESSPTRYPGGWSSGHAPGGSLKFGSDVHDPWDQSAPAGASLNTDVMSANSAAA